MPIVVDEVVLSVEVDTGAAPGGSPRGSLGSAAAPAASEDKQALVAECVERVLEILARREER